MAEFQPGRRILLIPLFLAIPRLTPTARAQQTAPDASSDWSLHTQATYIDQFHGSFPSAYEGPNSFTHESEVNHTFSFSLFLDRELWPGAELIYNPEILQGHGLSQALGIAGFPDGEAVKAGLPTCTTTRRGFSSARSSASAGKKKNRERWQPGRRRGRRQPHHTVGREILPG